jgi:hypothetical protein
MKLISLVKIGLFIAKAYSTPVNGKNFGAKGAGVNTCYLFSTSDVNPLCLISGVATCPLSFFYLILLLKNLLS